MRVRMISGGVKRVTVIGPQRSSHFVVREGRSRATSDRMKFTVIKPNGEIERGELRLDLGPVKRSSRRLRPIEKRIRKLIKAEHRALGRYLVLHDRSRRKRRNGWVGDLPTNLRKVIRSTT